MSIQTTPTEQKFIDFNFALIKDKARPGSWRRGYGYLKEKQIKDISMSENGVVAHVKGKFKEAYTIHLAFEPDDVKADCDCPLEEEWCKHAVAVALECVEQGLWHEYFGLPVDDEVVDTPDPDYEGVYRFTVRTSPPKAAPGKKPKKGVALRIENRKTGEPVTDITQVLTEAVETEKSTSREVYTSAQKREFNVMQLLLKVKQTKSGDGWFLVPLNEGDQLFQALSQVEEVRTHKGERVVFEKTPLRLTMAVNVSVAGNVLVSLHWLRTEPKEDVWPMQELFIFSPTIAWGYYKNRMYPLAHKLSNLPRNLTKSSFVDIRDADGGKFMYEVLPKLRKVADVEVTDEAQQASLKKKPPTKIFTVNVVDEATLKIQGRLEFSYDGVKVPYSKKTPETPYVMVTKKGDGNGKKSAKHAGGNSKKKKKGKDQKDQDETIYWVRRDLEAEENALRLLTEGGMELMQTNLLFAEGDDAIDFYNDTVNRLKGNPKDPWEFKFQDDMSLLKGSDFPLKIRAHLDFSDSVDQFVLKLDCAVGNISMTLEQVQRYLMQGKKYFFMSKQIGYVEIPLATILQFQKSLQAFDAKELSRQDTYLINTYKAGLLGELLEMGIEFQMSKKFREFWDVISANKPMEELQVPDSVNATLREYQKQGVNWLWFMYSYGLNGILADDMGLGKTLQALVVLQMAKNKDGQQPSLVVCPSSIVFNWIAEAEKFTPELNVIDLTGSDRHGAYKKIKDADLVITSYALLRRDIRALKEYNFRYAILDESQYIKNYESQTARASKDLQAGHRLALSGTPIENRLTELWSVFDFLMPGFMYGIEEFKYRYVSAIEEKGNRDAERRLKKQVFPFILRRLKQDVAKDLPPKIESIKYCELTEAQRDLYIDFLEETRDKVFGEVAEKGVDAARTSIFAALLRLRQICCHPDLMGDLNEDNLHESGKLDALKDMVEDIIDSGGRILLYSQFVEMLKIVRSWLERKNIKYEYLTGETRDRASVVNRFNTDESIPIFLISLKAGGVGLNLTGADYVIHYDPWWNPAAEDQATDRAHRIGQTKTVFVYRLITKGTVEEKIMKLQDRKRDLVDSIIAADRSVGKMLSFEDLKEILSADF